MVRDHWSNDAMVLMDRCGLIVLHQCGGSVSKEDYYYSHTLRPDDVKLLGRHYCLDNNNQWQMCKNFLTNFTNFQSNIIIFNEIYVLQE